MNQAIENTSVLPAEIRADALAMDAPAAAERAVRVVASYDIQDAGDADMASQELAELSGKRNAIEEKRKFLKEPSLEAGRRIDDFFRAPIATLDEQIRKLRSKIATYIQRVEDENRRKQEAARKVEAEAREKAIQAARLAEEEANKAEREGRDADADRLVQEAEQARSVVEAPPAPTHYSEPVRIAGTSSSRPWKAELTDEDLLFVAAATTHPHLRGLFKFDPSAANAMAKATKNAAGFPGLRFFQDVAVSSRSRGR